LISLLYTLVILLCVVGVLVFPRIVDINMLAAYALLAQAMQIIFWVIVGV
jgi:hypothetical protein